MNTEKTDVNQYSIHLKIEREQDLFNPFDLEKNLSEDVKSYIMSKLANKPRHTAVRIRVDHRDKR